MHKVFSEQSFFVSFAIIDQGRFIEEETSRVDEDLNVCVLHFLPEISTLSNSVAISLVKVGIQSFQFVT